MRRLAGLFALVTLTLYATTVRAEWAGVVTNEDGVEHVMNPDTPSESSRSLTPKLLWEVGGEDDEEILFGVLTHIASDDAGNIYVLDMQLNEVFVFDQSGEYVRSIGREGEGPGEFRRPADLFFTGDGNVAVMQRMPGKIVVLSPEGDPLGNLPAPEPADGGMQMFSGGKRAGDHIVLSTLRFARKESGMETRGALVAVDGSGNETASYFTSERSFSFGGEIDEKTFGNNELVWTADDKGNVYTSGNFDAYQFAVWSAYGDRIRVVEREYKNRERADGEVEPLRVMVRGRGGARRPDVKMSNTDRDIQKLFPRANGELWVLSSRGAFDGGQNVIATFDVYNDRGHFIRQLTVEGQGNYRDDGFHIVGDRLYVVRGLRSARNAMFGAASDEEEVEDADPVSVVCYDLGSTIVSK